MILSDTVYTEGIDWRGNMKDWLGLAMIAAAAGILIWEANKSGGLPTAGGEAATANMGGPRQPTLITDILMRRTGARR